MENNDNKSISTSGQGATPFAQTWTLQDKLKRMTRKKNNDPLTAVIVKDTDKEK